jgi:biotin synthase
MLSRNEILYWLRCDDPGELASLWAQADEVRRQNVGDAVHLRGLIEISSACVRQCAYCGLRAGNAKLSRYRMPFGEILACAHEAVKLGYGSVVMQAGEDPALEPQQMADIIRQIKKETALAITLSLGEREEEQLMLWRQAGADRYLLRFETSDAELYRVIHPPYGNHRGDRLGQLHRLREMGYEIGTGVMAGIPGQTFASLAHDIEVFTELDIDMLGIGPFIPHPETPLGDETYAAQLRAGAGSDQAPNTELTAYKMMALARIACPEANIPATTALASINKASGRELALQRGANVVMPNLTPVKYRAMYEIYPAKACIDETAAQCNGCLRGRIASIGRHVGSGPGGRRRTPCLTS